jgi:hypothetical protein
MRSSLFSSIWKIFATAAIVEIFFGILVAFQADLTGSLIAIVGGLLALVVLSLIPKENR